MEKKAIQIRFEDRPGLVRDVSEILLQYGFNIESILLMKNIMYLDIDRHSSKPWNSIIKEIKKISLIHSVDHIPEMPAIVHSANPMDDPPSDAFDDIVGDSLPIRQVTDMAKRVAEGDSTILLRGESGTGKGMFARAIHSASQRREKTYVPINCGAIPENLLESELFGFMDGAFSGAKKGGKIGLFQFADGGTVFLDEITELPMNLQVKLLRVLQEGYIRPLGSNREIPIDTRIIAATNRDIEAMVAKRSFREDLYYRLNVIPIYVPPLRQRKEDIPLLAKNYLLKHSGQGYEARSFSQAAIDRLKMYSWPGNVREFENIINRTLHLSPHQELSASDIIFDGDVGSACNAKDEKAHAVPKLKSSVHHTEMELISSALDNYGSLRAAAKALGVSHTTIANKIRKFDICVK